VAGSGARRGVRGGGPLSLEEDPEAAEAVVVPITDELDLHTFGPRDVPSVVSEYIHACREKGILRVRVIHGRGKGVQRAEVHRTLRSLPGVVSFADAPPASGGWGATVIDLTPGSADSEPL
jgi:DNA-nicking Smr family endonuclease